MRNNLKTSFLLALLTSLAVAVGYLAGGAGGIVLAFAAALVASGFACWFSDRVVLVALAGAREVSQEEAPALHRVVTELAVSYGVPSPRVYVSSDSTPNALAAGRNPRHAAVCVTAGLLAIMNEDELAGVLAHELAHMRSRDILISSVVGVLAGAITTIAGLVQWLLWTGSSERDDEHEGGLAGLLLRLPTALPAAIAATLVHLAISRSREYEADRAAGLVAGPLSLASALRKLATAQQQYPSPRARPAFAHLCIVDPLSRQTLAGLFSTHPPVEERVRRLEAMARPDLSRAVRTRARESGSPRREAAQSN